MQYKEEEPDIFLDPAYCFKKSWTRVANMLHFTNALKLNRFFQSVTVSTKQITFSDIRYLHTFAESIVSMSLIRIFFSG